jgi:hypothetical protein
MQRPRFNAVGGPTVPESRRRCALIPIEKVVDVVEADDADKNQIDGDDEVEQPRHDEDQDAGNKRDQRREMGRGDDHDHEPFGWTIGKERMKPLGRRTRQPTQRVTARPVLAGFAFLGTGRHSGGAAKAASPESIASVHAVRTPQQF